MQLPRALLSPVSRTGALILLSTLFTLALLCLLSGCAPPGMKAYSLLEDSSAEGLAKIEAKIAELEQNNGDPYVLLTMYSGGAHRTLEQGKTGRALELAEKGMDLLEKIRANTDGLGSRYRAHVAEVFKRNPEEIDDHMEDSLLTAKINLTAIMGSAYQERGDHEKYTHYLKLNKEALKAFRELGRRTQLARASSPEQRRVLKERFREVDDHDACYEEYLRLCGEAAMLGRGEIEAAIERLLAEGCDRFFSLRYRYGRMSPVISEDEIPAGLSQVSIYAFLGLEEQAREALLAAAPVIMDIHRRTLERIIEHYKSEFGISFGHLLAAVMNDSAKKRTLLQSLNYIFMDLGRLLRRSIEYGETELAIKILGEFDRLCREFRPLIEENRDEIDPFKHIDVESLARTYASAPSLELPAVEALLEQQIREMEKKRGRITSEYDRILLISKLRNAAAAMVSRKVRRGDAEAALELAMLTKARTLVDLFVAGGKARPASGGDTSLKDAVSTEGKRAIVVTPAFEEEKTVADMDIEAAAAVPTLKTLTGRLPQHTALLETFLTPEGLYTWLLTSDGIAGNHYVPLSTTELGGMVWRERRRVESGGLPGGKDIVEGEASVSVSLKSGASSLKYAAIALENSSPRPLSLIDISVRTPRKVPQSVEITASYVPSGERVTVAEIAIHTDIHEVTIGTNQGAFKGRLIIRDGSPVWLPSSGPRSGGRSKASLGVSLLGPFAEKLQSVDHLIVAPDGVLNYLPFDQLELNGRPAIESMAISILPSGALLAHLQAGNFDPGRVLIFGNPELGAVDLPELPGAEKEAKEIADILGGKSAPVLGARATESRFKQEARSASLIHVASHGIFLPEEPLDSFLALAPDGTNDGLLSVEEILGLDLEQSPLVVLSACQTGLNRLHEGNELFGFMRAFLAAGSSTLVASLWNVDDEATSFLMREFYLGLQEGLTPAVAMQRAKRAAIQSERFDDPAYWAAFFVVGAS